MTRMPGSPQAAGPIDWDLEFVMPGVYGKGRTGDINYNW